VRSDRGSGGSGRWLSKKTSLATIVQTFARVPLCAWKPLFCFAKFGIGLAIIQEDEGLLHLEMKAMRIAILIFCLVFFVAGAAFGQVAASSISAQPTIVEFQTHDQHASQHDMGRTQNVMEESIDYVGHGERPLWEVAPPVHEVSLGEAARALKAEHAAAKKSKIVWTN